MTANNEGIIVPLFQTFEQLQSAEQEIAADFFKDWHAAMACYEMRQAVISGDTNELAKFDGAEVELAKAVVAESVKKYHSHGHTLIAMASSQSTLTAELLAALDRRDERMFGLGAVAKRSARFSRRAATPSDCASSTPISTSIRAQ